MAPQTLLSLVVRLQQMMSVAQGRAMLLDYARKSCGARLALFFTLTQERQRLVLLDYSGRHPHPSSFVPETTLVELSLDGLFASALQLTGFIDVPDITNNSLSLPEERALAWSHGRVLLYALRQGQRQGVLVFCFSPAGSRVALSSQTEEELIIAASLLSAYISEDEDLQLRPRMSAQSLKARRQSRRVTRTGQVKNKRQIEEARMALSSPDALKALVTLCEVGLLRDPGPDGQELVRQVVRTVGELLGASGGGLWRFLPEQDVLSLWTYVGVPEALITRASAELASLTKLSLRSAPEVSSGLSILSEADGQDLLWHVLRYRGQWPGVIGLVVASALDVTLEQRLLLEAASAIVALILLRYEQRSQEEEVLIEKERQRIARELHDSVIQDLAHVGQKLDYIQRTMEKQPQNALNEIDQARHFLNRSLRDLRYGISSLLPVPLEEQGFDEALKALLHEYSLNSPHLKINCSLDSLALWPQALRAPVYRFMQEALNNIRKHASASEVSIRVQHVAGLGVVQVSDNGRGFVPEQVHNLSQNSSTMGLHMGLIGMEERIRQAGGALEIRSKPGEGTILKARFSLAQFPVVLTEREREVLRLLVDGLTNRAISERLSVSLETVKSHVHHIMQKMHVKDRTQAAVVATRQQWL